MVARMTNKLLAACLLASGASLVNMGSLAHAGPLPDPTRPPAAMLATPAAAASAPTDALQLQSVLLGRGRTPAAVISGELVLLGGRIRDAKLVRVTERVAVLRGAQGDITLSLTPDAIKRQGNSPAIPEPTK